MAEQKKRFPETMMVSGSWNVGAYKYKAPNLMPEYVSHLKEKRIVGSMCPGCGKVIVQPRNICGRCHMRMTERIEVSHIGAINIFVKSEPVTKGKYTIFGMDPIDMGMVAEGEVIMPVFVQFDGANSNVLALLLNADPDKVHNGMRVRAVFAEERTGALGDLMGVEPLEEENRK